MYGVRYKPFDKCIFYAKIFAISALRLSGGESGTIKPFRVTHLFQTDFQSLLVLGVNLGC